MDNTTPQTEVPINTTDNMVVGSFDNKLGQELQGAKNNAEAHAVSLLNKVRFHLSTKGAHDGALEAIKADFVAFFDRLFAREPAPTPEAAAPAQVAQAPADPTATAPAAQPAAPQPAAPQAPAAPVPPAA